MCPLVFKHSSVTPRKRDLGRVCARTVFGDVALLRVNLDTTFQGLWHAQLGKSFLKLLAKVREPAGAILWIPNYLNYLII